ncbi:hypothetical protein BV22DRAFT_1030235 [Leucogyrophana mollusca]|uniref:Uncharacterized protein n=1 Tax=Leucogyrophana mollusca TaxID=85980 RepID=A0ACB8BUQ1_9AGAM|nr:hypothetical protein BV22DRAFT_1030235 [Leucogyrophana mollusca]
MASESPSAYYVSRGRRLPVLALSPVTSEKPPSYATRASPQGCCSHTPISSICSASSSTSSVVGERRNKIRPLPHIPTLVTTTTQKSPRVLSPRPLPTPPTKLPKPIKSTSLPPIPLGIQPPPPTPLTPPSAQSSKAAHLPPLTIPSTSSCSLSSSSSLVTPTSPEHPSPFTTKRRRFSKLRRHFGDAPPIDLVFRADPKADHSKSNNLHTGRWGESFISFDSAFDNEEDHSHSEVDVHLSESEDGSAYNECVAGGQLGGDPEAKHHYLTKQHSKKWIREKGGRRWTERDYNNVLQGLRNL